MSGESGTSGTSQTGGAASLLSDQGQSTKVNVGGDQTQQTQQTQVQTPPAFTFPKDFDYKSIIPEDLKADPFFSKYNDLDGVFRGAVNAQKLIGKDPANLVEITPNMDPAATRAVMNRLGASEKAEDYKIAPVNGAPEWLGGDQPLGKWLAQTAHAEGIPIGAMNKLYGGFVAQMTEAAKAQAAAAVDLADKSIAGMKQKYGDDFDPMVRRAKLAIEKLGGSPLREALEGADLGVNPVVLEALAKAGALFEEGTDGGEKGQGGNDLPSEMKQRATEMIAQSHGPQYDKDPIGRAKLQADAQKLLAKAAGGRKL